MGVMRREWRGPVPRPEDGRRTEKTGAPSERAREMDKIVWRVVSSANRAPSQRFARPLSSRPFGANRIRHIPSPRVTKPLSQ